MKLLNANFSVCKTAGEPKINPAAAFCFTDRTDEVCQTDDVPAGTTEGRRAERPFAFRERWIFSPVGILTENKIGIFVISAFHTDDVPVKREAV